MSEEPLVFQPDPQPPYTGTVFEESLLPSENCIQNQELVQIASLASYQDPELKSDSESHVKVVKSWWQGEEVEEMEMMAPKTETCTNNVRPPKVMESYVNDLQASSFAQKFFYFYQGELIPKYGSYIGI